MTGRYISAEAMTKDDFGDLFTMAEGEVIYDAVTAYRGQWATMTEASYRVHSHPSKQLGTGHGQKYQRNATGQLLKVGG